MGDRANVMVRETGGGTIFLYTHWNGYEWPERLREALANSKDRWDDEAYLTRYLSTSMFSDLTGTTGGGISTTISDNEYPIIVVDVAGQRVAFAPESDPADPEQWYAALPISEYVAQDKADYPAEA